MKVKRSEVVVQSTPVASAASASGSTPRRRGKGRKPAQSRSRINRFSYARNKAWVCFRVKRRYWNNPEAERARVAAWSAAHPGEAAKRARIYQDRHGGKFGRIWKRRHDKKVKEPLAEGILVKGQLIPTEVHAAQQHDVKAQAEYDAAYARYHARSAREDAGRQLRGLNSLTPPDPPRPRSTEPGRLYRIRRF